MKHGALTLLVALFLLQKPVSAQPTVNPNVILVLVDDLGWHEFGCYGNTFNESPQVDRLAGEGVCFTNAYSTAPVCSPARSSIMIGQLPVRSGITDYLDDNFVEFLDPARFVSLARTLKNNGYHTGIIGKWHLDGHQDGAGLVNTGNGRPALNGFDEVICSETRRIGGGDYIFPYTHLPGLTQRIFPEENLMARMNLEAVDFVARNRTAPFFLYLSHYAVHTTLDAPDSLVAIFNAKRGTPGTNTSPTQNPYLGAMLKLVDDGVGQIIAKLKENGLDSNTIIIVTSDNGGESTVTDNGVLRVGKSYLYEGGIRIPFIARWPGRFATGAVRSTPVSLVDLYPTIAALTGAALPQNQPMDGLNIAPLLSPSGTIAGREILWHYPRVVPHFLGGTSSGALLQGSFKLIRFYETDILELYNIASDISEANNLSADSSALVRSMASKLHLNIGNYLQNFIFQDDFSDNNAADWNPFGGTWSAAAGRYTATAGDGFKSVTDRKYYTNFMYEADVAVLGGTGNAGLVCRATNAATGTDAYRGYYAGINAQTDMVTFGRANNGAWTLLGQRAKQIDTTTVYRLRVVAQGPQFKIYVDDTLTPLIAVSDSTFNGGLIGLRSHRVSAAFDNVFAIGLGPDSPSVAIRKWKLLRENAALPALKNSVISRGGLMRIPFPAQTRRTDYAFGLFDLVGRTVQNPFAVEISKDAWLLRLSPYIESGLYIMHISIDGHGQTVRLLMR